MTQQHFDLIVIGSGPGGYRAAILAALRGKQVAIVEKAQWGGCCLNRGCVPKKDWHHSARLISASRQFDRRGLSGPLSGDLAQAWQHQNEVVGRVRESYTHYLKRLGVSHFEGHGRFLDNHTIAIEGEKPGQTIGAEHLIIATGSEAIVPPPFELMAGRILSTDMLFDSPPPAGARVAIIGAGVIAAEFAFILKMFGKQIDWLGRSGLLRRSQFSPQALGVLRQGLSDHGIELVRYENLSDVRVTEESVTIEYDDRKLEVDWVLLATGRRPYTDQLGLENTEVEMNQAGFIQRNEHLQTSGEPHIYAIGDCTSAQMTANQALADASVAIENIINGNHRQQQPGRVPSAVYSAVELARIGMDEDEAEDEGFEPAVGFAAFETSPRAMGQDDEDGFVRILADMDSGEFLGGEVVGHEAGELITLLAQTENWQTALAEWGKMHVNHPTRAEELLNAVETMASKWGLNEFIYPEP